jgi:hypothetical protein
VRSKSADRWQHWSACVNVSARSPDATGSSYTCWHLLIADAKPCASTLDRHQPIARSVFGPYYHSPRFGFAWVHLGPFGQVLRRPAPKMRHSRQLPASVPRRPACPSAADCRPSGAPSLRSNSLSCEAGCNRFAAHASRQLEHRHMCRCCQAIVCSSAPVARGFVSNARSHDLMPRNGFGSIEK